MGFFKDFKRDFAQAVNEMMPEDGEISSEYDDEDMVNTFDDDLDTDTEIDPDDLLDEVEEDAADGDEAAEAMTGNMAKAFDSVPDEALNDSMMDAMIETLAPDEDLEEDELIGPAPETEEESDEEEELYEENEDDDSDEEEPDEEDDRSEEEEEDEEIEDSEYEDTDGEAEIETDIEAAEDMSIDAAVRDTLTKEADDEAADEVDDEVDDMEATGIRTKDVMTEKKESIDSVMSDDTTYITKGTKITGDIETDGGVDVLGSVTGNIKCMGKLILGGQVKGNVNAGEIYANAAKLEGEVTTDGGVKIGVGSVVIGNITATSAVIAGAVNGDIDIKGPVIVDSTAVVMGNIKSRSVQINNGAVIEGFCSQCYSEIDVKSFFGNAD